MRYYLRKMVTCCLFSLAFACAVKNKELDGHLFQDSGMIWQNWMQNPQNQGQYAYISGLKAESLYRIFFILSEAKVGPGQWAEIAAVSGHPAPAVVQDSDYRHFESFNTGILITGSDCSRLKPGFVKLSDGDTKPCAQTGLLVTTNRSGNITLLTKWGGGGLLKLSSVQMALAKDPHPENPEPENPLSVGQEACGDYMITYNEAPIHIDLQTMNSEETFPPGYSQVGLVSFERKGGDLRLSFAAQMNAEGKVAIPKGSAPFGARLLKAKYKGKNLLFANSQDPDSTNWIARISRDWGRHGIIANSGRDPKPFYKKFISFAGVEAAFPNQEHGEFGNDIWDYEVKCLEHTRYPELGTGLRPTFIAHFRGGEEVGRQAFRNEFRKMGELSIYTVLSTDASGKEQWAEILESEDKRMFFSNLMIPAGTKSKPDRIEVIVPSDAYSRAFIHSAGGPQMGGGYLPSGDIDNIENPQENGDKMRRGEGGYVATFLKDRNRILRDAASWRCPNNNRKWRWIGWFLLAPNSGGSDDISFEKISGSGNFYGFFNRGPSDNPGEVKSVGLLMHSPNGFYPKFFCGPDLTHEVNVQEHLYCEMWFSANAPTFWHGFKDYDNGPTYSLGDKDYDKVGKSPNGSYDGNIFFFTPIETFPATDTRSSHGCG